MAVDNLKVADKLAVEIAEAAGVDKNVIADMTAAEKDKADLVFD